MNQKLSTIISLSLALILYSNLHAFSFGSLLTQTKEKLRSVFVPAKHSQVVQQDIKRTTQKTLVVENMQGNLKIKTDWNQEVISLKAVKSAQEADLSKISIAINTKSPDTITITTVYLDPNIRGSVDYTLMIPKAMTVRLKTAQGSIRVKRFDGHVWATTDSGTIEIAQVSHSITAMVNEWGSIAISQSKGPIHASTCNGNIDIENAQDSIIACTEKGNITLDAQSIPTTCFIELDAQGIITAYLPEETNAHIRAQSTAGKITSDHYITLASQTTKLNEQTWVQLRRNVEGTLGTGEAEISLASNSGIKILTSDVA